MARTMVDGVTRCKAITFAGQPGHLLVRCALEEHEKGDHVPSWSKEDENA